MAKEEETYQQAPTLGFRIFRGYVRLYHKMVFFSKCFSEGKENIPSDGTPTLFVSCHQNSLIDPIAIIMDMCPRRMGVFIRGDVFLKSPLFFKILRWLGGLPAFRLNVDGEDMIAQNKKWFGIAGDELMKGRSTLIFPEGTHQDKHWLGDFSLGYLQLLFETAERNNFEKDILILPIGHHYNNYYDLRMEMDIIYGKPISLQPFYELYKTKPRTAKREANKLVREKISELMLDVKDKEHYDAIAAVRKIYGRQQTIAEGGNPNHLPTQLKTDKKIVEKLALAAENNEQAVLQIYETALSVSEAEEQEKLNDLDFEEKTSMGGTIAHGLLLLLFFPVYVVTLWPYLIIDKLPKWILGDVADMMKSTIAYGAAVLLTLPITFLITFITTWYVGGNVLIALAYTAALYPLGAFYYAYKNQTKRWVEKWRYCFGAPKKTLISIKQKRKNLIEKLSLLLSKNENK